MGQLRKAHRAQYTRPRLLGESAALDLERLKGILEAGPSDSPLDDSSHRATASMVVEGPSNPAEVELSFASSIGAPLPPKNVLNKSHDKIKQHIPRLNFSKLHDRADLRPGAKHEDAAACKPRSKPPV